MALTNEDLLAISELLDNKLQPIKEEIPDMKTDMQKLKKHMTNIEVYLENVIDNNIKIIAEGHTDLARKLDDALTLNNEKELLLIRMSYLEEEVKKIKERLAQIA